MLGLHAGLHALHNVELTVLKMKKLWSLFSQVVTVLLAVWFILVTLKPEWLHQSAGFSGLSLSQAPPLSAGSDAQVYSPGSFSQAAKKASPAVVSINTSKVPEKGVNKNDPWQRFFFGEREEAPSAGLGSGVIVSPEGYILTNYHVVEEADEIEVSLNDGRKSKAQIIGVDPDSDLAVLRIKLDRLPVIVLGKSENLQVGDQVLAIGNPLVSVKPSPVALCRPWGATNWGSTPLRTSFKRMRPSIPATRAAPWWM